MTGPDAGARPVPRGASRVSPGVAPRVGTDGVTRAGSGVAPARSDVATHIPSGIALLAALAGALAVRLAVAGPAGVRSVPAGAVFAVLLGGVALAAAGAPAFRPGSPGPQLVFGALGAAVLCAVPLVAHLTSPGGALPTAGLPVWALVVSAVAVAEEVLLRGALWTALAARRGDGWALGVTTVAFALLHVPLYGWSALPLDCAVGLLLGALRMLAGGWGAPALAHTVADLAGWWLR
jgi:membrane protease YdiL (CAAX protease family)